MCTISLPVHHAGRNYARKPYRRKGQSLGKSADSLILEGKLSDKNTQVFTGGQFDQPLWPDVWSNWTKCPHHDDPVPNLIDSEKNSRNGGDYAIK
jgi:hypothetical protein